MGLEIEVGGEQFQVAVTDVLAVLEAQLDLGVVDDFAQVPHGCPPPARLEHTQKRLLQVLGLTLQTGEVRPREVVEDLVSSGVPVGTGLGAKEASQLPCSILSVSLE